MISKFKKFNWFRLNRNLHRDIGYFCIGMTIIFCVSGIAVNHNDDWNPNYKVVRDVIQVPATQWDDVNDRNLIQQVMSKVETESKVKASYWAAPNHFKVFLKDNGNLSLNLDKNTIVFERIEARPIFQAFNRLHLNEAHKSWVIFSDIFAAMLLFLAISALFMVKGEYGPLGKKSIYIFAGILLPLIYIFI